MHTCKYVEDAGWEVWRSTGTMKRPVCHAPSSKGPGEDRPLKPKERLLQGSMRSVFVPTTNRAQWTKRLFYVPRIDA